MEQQAENRDLGRCLWTALLVVVPVVLAGCQERPAYVLSPDRSEASYYPGEHRQTFEVTVRNGDSVSKIAERCDTTTSEIVELNGLDESRPIYPGQVLRVPSPPREEAADLPHPQPRPHPDSVVRIDAPLPHRRPAHADSDPPPPPPPVQAADAGGDRQSWWSTWWSKPADDTAGGDTEKFIWPVKGHVIAGFGPGSRGERNDGINIEAQDGAPVHAAAAGTVTYTGNELKGYGNLVLIRHSNGFVTAYAHVGAIRVKRGDAVNQGQVIAVTGATGDVDRPQLHFEIRRGVQAVDPARYLASERAS